MFGSHFEFASTGTATPLQTTNTSHDHSPLRRRLVDPSEWDQPTAQVRFLQCAPVY